MVELVLGCSACPEAYDAFIDNVMVGYLRLRHGKFTVECPDSGGERVFLAFPKGDGIFDADERDHYLNAAIEAINIWYTKQKLENDPWNPPNLIYQ